MLRSVWRHLKKDWTRTSRRPGRASTRRPTLEVLEDRLALSSATQLASTLRIVADPGTSTAARTILLQVDSVNPSKLDVKDNSTLLGQFSIGSINTVNVQVAGNDAIKVDDSNGFPFAPGTSVALFGSGANNSLNLLGSRAIAGGELFDAGTSTQNGLLSLAGSTFHFTDAIAKVTDDLADTGSLQVQTTAPAVSLVGGNGATETLKGLAGAGGGGNILTFRGKANVDLQLRGDNETADLNATAAAQGLQSFTVEQLGKNDTVNVNATPSFAGIPLGGTFIDNPGPQDQVSLRANSGTVNIFGTSTTTVVLGSNDTDFSKSVTSAINGLVSVHNVGALNIEDGGNVKTQEHVTVTESSITGTGLFGTNGSVQYSSLTPGLLVPQIFTGQLANTYTVTTSGPGASFNEDKGHFMLISDRSSTGGLNVQVDANPLTDLSLSVVSKSPATSSLFISAAPGADFNPFILPKPSGFEDLTFPAGPPGSKATLVSYSGFDTVGHS
jgi:hypothetical protein